MSGLLFLTSEDFNVTKGSKGSILSHEIRGFSLVLFYSTQCKYCQTLIPIFKKLPTLISGCQFGIINVSVNKSVVRISKDTISPVQYVPYIVFYVDGNPFMEYKGPHDMKEIQRFIVEVANNVNNSGMNDIPEKSQKKKIPEYCTGQPLCGNGDVCYLDFDDAYGKK